MLSPDLHKPPNPLRKLPGRRGVALVIVLAFVVLLTGLVVAFFSRTITDRQLSNGSYAQAAADQLARSALSLVTSDLKEELIAGSQATTIGSTTVYTAQKPVYMLPQRSGVPTIWSTTAPNKTLLRASGTIAISSGSPEVDQMASNALITGTSANGRSVSLARWNQHYLIPLSNTSNPMDTTPDGNLTTPSWVYVTSGGPKVLNTPASNVVGRYAYAVYDESGLLDVNVAGYPSTIPYQSGVSTPSPYIFKGSVADADLTQLSGTVGGALTYYLNGTAVNSLIGFRSFGLLRGAGLTMTGNFPNIAFGGSGLPSQYQSLIASNTNGFLTVSGSTNNNLTDQMFLTRQELISIALSMWASNASFNPNALQYLGTFSRALTTPTWSPSADSSSMSNYVNAQGSSVYTYKTSAEPTGSTNSASANPDFANVRFTTAGTVTHWNDGTVSGSGTMINSMTSTTYAVKSGDPLLQRRFSLSKLAWFSQGLSPTGTYTTAIQACFGLVSGNNTQGVNCWVYAGPKGTTGQAQIETLAQVAAENPPREPNFFELLKAGILNGSLGRDPGPSPSAGVVSNAAWAEVWGQQSNASYNTPAGQNFYSYSDVADSQIIQIGANIIDQYDADSIPTQIYFPVIGLSTGASATQIYLNALCNTFSGVENLPYMASLRPVSYANSGGQHLGWLQPSIWNPQIMTSGTRGQPSNFRLHAYGPTEISDWSGGTAVGLSYEPTPTYPGIQYIMFSDPGGPSSVFYNVPLFLSSTNGATVSSGSNTWQASYGTGNAGQFTGFYAGAYMPPASTPAGNSMIIGANDPQTITVVLEYSTNGGGSWVPYSLFSRYDAFNGGGSNVGTTPTVQGNFDIGRIDPRTDRFSTQMGWPPYGFGTYWPQNGTVYGATAFTPNRMSGFTYTPGNTPVGQYSVNQIANGTYYADRDGVVRPGDAYRYNTTTGDGLPTFISNGAPAGTPIAAGDNTTIQQGRRPIVLNRPFQSVGELGYTFRDLPFKTLDFWSANSADAGLLDLFCIQDDPAPMVAGEINPTDAPAPVLQAIIAGASKKVSDSTYNVSGEAATIATAMANSLVSTGPLANRGELATKLGPVVSGTSSTVVISGSIAVNVAYITSTATNANLANKAYAEAPIRALSDVTQTRTWNLMVDVVAQAGTFTPNATDLSKGFVVQGEKRYWLHIAIDRYTGKVIDQTLEPVYD